MLYWQLPLKNTSYNLTGSVNLWTLLLEILSMLSWLTIILLSMNITSLLLAKLGLWRLLRRSTIILVICNFRVIHNVDVFNVKHHSLFWWCFFWQWDGSWFEDESSPPQRGWCSARSPKLTAKSTMFVFDEMLNFVPLFLHVSLHHKVTKKITFLRCLWSPCQLLY